MNEIIQGDALTVLATLPDASVQCVVTSPPYYGLRDYGVEGQIGLEETPGAYVQKLVQVFREVRRVLREDGLLWLNLGDSYANDAKWGGSTGGKHAQGLHGNSETRDRRTTGLAPKNLMMIPARVAIALQDNGWILRSDIIWSKNNAMPESVKNRPTKSHEHMFMLAKSEKYYYDAEAIAEPTEYGARGRSFMRGKTAERNSRQGKSDYTFNPTRNRRDVWSIATQPLKESHFACMPPRLAELCILAGSRPGDVVLDPFSGAGTTALVANNLGRKYIGIELNPEYVEMSQRRLVQPALAFEWIA